MSAADIDDDLPEQYRIRQAKRERLLAEGVDPYPVTVPRTHTLAQIRAAHPDLAADTATVLEIGASGQLLETEPWIRESLRLRNIYTEPLNMLQAELLRRNRQAPEPVLERAIMVTIAGVAAGMRNTG